MSPSEKKAYIASTLPRRYREPRPGGMTYDRHATKVTVTVTDDADHPGKLKATVEYNNGTVSDKTDKAVFKNNYESSLVYGTTGALNIQKVLNGRTMKAGEFEFTYGPKDGQTVKSPTRTSADPANRTP